MEMTDMLRKVPLFAELDECELRAVALLARSLNISKNSIVFQESEQSDSMYVILQGRVKVSSHSPDGREIVMALLEKGSFFGELSLLDDEPRSATVTTMEDSKLAHIRRSDVVPLLMDQPEITLKIARELATRLRRASRVLERISSMDVPHRLYAHLAEQCQRFGQPDSDGFYSMVLPTHQLLADQLSTSRETISRAISQLKKSGVLTQESGRGKVRVDIGALEQLLDNL